MVQGIRKRVGCYARETELSCASIIIDWVEFPISKDKLEEILTNSARYITLQISYEGHVPHEWGILRGFFFGIRPRKHFGGIHVKTDSSLDQA
jgi:hypothetical protein